MNNSLLFALNKNPSPLRPTEEDAMLGSKTKHVAVTPESVKGSRKWKASTTSAHLLFTSRCSNRQHSFQLLHQQPLSKNYVSTQFCGDYKYEHHVVAYFKYPGTYPPPPPHPNIFPIRQCKHTPNISVVLNFASEEPEMGLKLDQTWGICHFTSSVIVNKATASSWLA